jgi:hypothetical protein
MKPFSHAFEIGYSPALEVLDQSEVFLDCLPGTPAFSQILPRFEGEFNSEQTRKVEQGIALFPRMQEWVNRPAAEESFHVGDAYITVAWQRPIERAGVFSIRMNAKIASVSLVMCRNDDLDADIPSGSSMLPMLAFMEVLSRIVPAEGVYDHRKFQLVAVTRRPLLASVFWPPFSPANDCIVRTIQLQMAYAVFRMNGELS